MSQSYSRKFTDEEDAAFRKGMERGRQKRRNKRQLDEFIDKHNLKERFRPR